MNTPGPGKNNIPNRLKRHFFMFTMVMPSKTTVDNIYGQMLKIAYPSSVYGENVMEVVNKLTSATIAIWDAVKGSFIPTPQKFH